MKASMRIRLLIAVLFAVACGRSTFGLQPEELATCAGDCPPGGDTGTLTASFAINAGAMFTNLRVVTLTFGAPTANAYGVADSAVACTETTAWLPLVTPTTYELPVANATNTLFAKVKNDAGERSACVSASIIHDELLPYPPHNLHLVWAADAGATDSPTLTFNSGDRGPSGMAGMQARIVEADLGNEIEAWRAFAYGLAFQGLNTLTPGIRYRIELRGVDRAGNIGPVTQSEAWSTAAAEHTLLAGIGLAYLARVDDLNGDGKLDVLVYEYLTRRMAWFRQRGVGEFDLPTTLLVMPQPLTDMALADLNGDGLQDLLVATESPGEVLWFANEFEDLATFGPAQQVASGLVQANAVAVADLDQNDELDILVSDTGADTVWSYLNNGGSFAAGTLALTSITAPETLAVGDLNGDARPDLVVSSASVGLHWAAGDSLGAFGAPELVSALASAVELADLDGDLWLDIVASSEWYRNSDGAGHFAAATPFQAGVTFTRAAVGQLNNDTAPDLLLEDPNQLDKTIVAALNSGTGSFAVPTTALALPFGQEINRFFAADLDDDGLDDTMILQGDPSGIVWARNLGSGTDYAPRQPLGIPTLTAYEFALADLDSDLDLDVVVAAEEGVYWFANDGLGTMAPPRVVEATRAIRLVTADLDGDGDVDLATTSGSAITWYRNNGGSFTLAEQVDVGVSYISDLDAHDLTGDGIAELLVAVNNTNTIAYYANDGTGSFGPMQVVSASQPEANAVTAGDLDGDGDADIVSAAARVFDSHVRWFRNEDGAGTFSAPLDTPGSSSSELLVVDLDADGQRDILCFSFSSWYWLKNNGAGSFAATAASGFSYLTSAVPGDLDHDGDLDILIAEQGNNGMVSWAENQGAGIFATAIPLSTVAENTAQAAIGDINGDGKVEGVVLSDVNSAVYWFSLHP